MDERRFCCGCGLCSSDGILAAFAILFPPRHSPNWVRLCARLVEKVFKDKLFFGNTCSRSPYFSIFLSVFARSGRLSKEVLVTTSFRTGCVCPRRAGNVRSRRPCGRVPGSMRSSPKSAERESERGEAGRFMADSENNQDKFWRVFSSVPEESGSGLRFFV